MQRVSRMGIGDNIVIFMTFGQSLVFAQCDHHPEKVSQVSYGLLNPFLNGMDVKSPSQFHAKIIDGYGDVVRL